MVLADNPSHLEAVSPVVEGLVRAHQQLRDDVDQKHIVPVLIHGDASFAGQGIVSETLNMSQLDGYKTGGTIHIVVNNQIGFTTDPKDSRSSLYCTDVVRQIAAPVFHVNADDPESVVHCVQIACEFRQKFHHDVVIDLVCYRRHGHNEGDEPSFTQPLMYKLIRKLPSSRKVYVEQLIGEGELEAEVARKSESEFKSRMQAALEMARNEDDMEFEKEDGEHFHVFRSTDKDDWFAPVKTTVSKKILQELAKGIDSMPKELKLHRKISRLLMSEWIW